MSGIYPGLTLSWCTRQEQQSWIAYLQSGEVILLAIGSIVKCGLSQLDWRKEFSGWQWMFLVQGTATCTTGIFTYWEVVDFPEKSKSSFRFLSTKEMACVVARIQEHRAYVQSANFTSSHVLRHFADPENYGFAGVFFLNVVSTALAYFIPTL